MKKNNPKKSGDKYRELSLSYAMGTAISSGKHKKTKAERLLSRQKKDLRKKVRFVPKPKRDMRMEYEGYIKSMAWAALKMLKGESCPRVCANCESVQNVECHHMCYRDSLSDGFIGDLLWLCKGCHVEFHKRSKVFSHQLSSAELVRKTLSVLG